MGWSIGYDEYWKRDIGYGVPALCDHPDCNEEIDRGLSYVCGGEPYGGERGCGLYFCEKHRHYIDELDDEDDDEAFTDNRICERCLHMEPSFTPKQDTPEWINWKLTDESWQQWRDENPEKVQEMQQRLRATND